MIQVGRNPGRVCALALAVVALLALTVAAPASAKGDPTAGASVIGGHPIKTEEYPWLAYIEAEIAPRSGLVFSCTGTVVAPRVVLTAGHCVEDLEAEVPYSASTYRVATGVASHLRVLPSQISRVSRTLLFPGFRPATVHGDAGLLILTKPVAAPPLPLASAADSALIAPGAPIEIAGWGLTDIAREDGPAVARAGKLIVQKPARCRRGKDSLFKHFSATQQFCALDTPAFKTSGCFGDSGGPAISHRADGSAVEVGIVSAGGAECERREPNLYTRVELVSPWVSEWIAAVELGAPAPPIAKLPPPRMSQPEAEYLALHGLAEGFTRPGRSHRLDFEETLRLGCTRADRSEFRCRVHWHRHGSTYFGTIAVRYEAHTRALVWNDRYTIHWVSEDCKRTAKDPRTCAVHTRQHRHGAPKHIPEF